MYTLILTQGNDQSTDIWSQIIWGIVVIAKSATCHIGHKGEINLWLIVRLYSPSYQTK